MAEGAVKAWAEETQPFYFWRVEMIRVVTIDGLQLTVQIGEIDKLRHLREMAHKTCFLQANGDELDLILGQMSVPTVTGVGIISWYGDDAKFIAGNFIYGE